MPQVTSSAGLPNSFRIPLVVSPFHALLCTRTTNPWGLEATFTLLPRHWCFAIAARFFATCFAKPLLTLGAIFGTFLVVQFLGLFLALTTFVTSRIAAVLTRVTFREGAYRLQATRLAMY